MEDNIWKMGSLTLVDIVGISLSVISMFSFGTMLYIILKKVLHSRKEKSKKINLESRQ
jgi:hypothetical protein